MIAHFSVVSLVAATSVAGFATTQGHDGAGRSSDAGFLSLVSGVRGAGEPGATQELSELSYDLNALSEEATLLDRGAPARQPDAPMPTPVPVDPDATPLPAPGDGSSVGATVTEGPSSGGNEPTAPSTRVAQPARAPRGLVWPVPGGSITQYFNAGHLALDIAAPYGSQVVASQAGTVTWAGWRNNGGGIVVSIDHGNGMTTVYNHLGSAWVSPGQYVGAGQGIAGVGCTGMCTGPHVHYEVIVNGVFDNPLRYL